MGLQPSDAQRKQKHARKRTSDYYIVYEKNSNVLLGRLTNLSLGGFMLIGTDSIPDGRTIACRIDFPGNVNGVEEITVEATSVWSRENNRADWWETGFKLHDVSPLIRSVIEHLIETWDDHHGANQTSP